MSKWKNFCKSVSQLTEKALKKTEELTDVAALHVKIKTLEAKINEQYENLGALTYAKLKGGADSTEEAADIVTKIDGYLTEIAAHKLRLAKMEEEKEAAKRAKAAAEEASAKEKCDDSPSPVDLGPECKCDAEPEQTASDEPHVFSFPGDDEDSKLLEAVQLAVESGKISTSLIQRKLEVGYGRSAKLLDRMEELGYISAPNGNMPRRVLINADDLKVILEHSPN